MGAVPIHLFTAQALNDGEQMAPTSKKCQAWVSGYLEWEGARTGKRLAH